MNKDVRELPGIRAGGEDLVRASAAHRRKMQEIRLDVIGRYSREYANASRWQKSLLLVKIEWIVAREQWRWDPSNSLYAQASGNGHPAHAGTDQALDSPLQEKTF